MKTVTEQPRFATRMTPARKTQNFSAVTAVVWALALAIMALVAGWQRRWISDDGLIVLRTVRNLQAGNGPVFNAGERVETNTSMLWQYAIYLFAQLTGGELETVALWLGLILTGLAVGLGTLATGLMYRSRGSIFLPFGMLIYLAIPPARDFATSGLEWGLSIFWLAVLWFFLVSWVRENSRLARHGMARNRMIYWLALWSGLSWLVRPELVLYGAVTGLIILIAARSWAQRALILAIAIPLPLAYQIFRMGYYGAIVPQTAVAKSASDSLWGRGWDYVGDFVNPYGMWSAFGVLALVAAVLLLLPTFRGSSSSFSDANSPRTSRLQGQVTIVAILVVCALIHFAYVIRVGGDFMHGRMLLIPLFAILLPLAVVPVWDLQAGAESQNAGQSNLVLKLVQPLAVGSGCVFAVVWGINAVNHPVTFSGEGVKSSADLHVVDERSFWMQVTKTSPEEPPLYASDYEAMDLMYGYKDAQEECTEQRRGDPASTEARECSGLLIPIRKDSANAGTDWIPIGGVGLNSPGTPLELGAKEGAQDLQFHPMTVNFLNLGVTGMLAPLDVRVVDPMGLANPLAARMPQIKDGRPGHDKSLPQEWQYADSAVYVPFLPPFIDGEEVEEIRPILYTEDFVELFQTYRAPMSTERFWENIKYSLTTSRTLKFSDDIDDYEGVQPVPEAQIAWPQQRYTD